MIDMIFLFVLLFLAIIFLFVVFPSIRRHPDREILNNLYIAHRGLHCRENGIPENSVSAFSNAIVNGFAIETDIRLTRDGEVVVFHDENLKRMCGQDAKIENLTLSELRQYKLLNTNERIPSFKEFLDLVEGRVPLLLEFKCNAKNCKQLCIAANRLLKEYNGKYFVQSFYPGVPFWYRKNRNDILRGQLATVFKEKNDLRKFLSPFIFNFLTRPDFVAYDVKFSKRFMFCLQKILGAFSVGWTFKKNAQLEKLKNDFKAYIFEDFMP